MNEYEKWEIQMEVERVNSDIAKALEVVYELMKEKERLINRMEGKDDPDRLEMTADMGKERLEKLHRFIESLKATNTRSIQAADIARRSKEIFGVELPKTTVYRYLAELNIPVYCGWVKLDS